MRLSGSRRPGCAELAMARDAAAPTRMAAAVLSMRVLRDMGHLAGV